VRRTALSLAVAACAAAFPCAASARATATVDAGTVIFYADTLTLLGRGGATLRLADGTRADADAVYVDLKTDRAVLAGHARAVRGTASTAGDAIALEIDGTRVDVLDAASGVMRTDRALGPGTSAPFEAERFVFPDVDDRYAYIRSKRAAITPRANVRFTPAAFPTSVGAFPVPSYLYTYAVAAGFGSTSLPGATFDQPYGLFGTPSSLTALHARYEDGPGAVVALEQHVVSGDDAYVTSAIDAPIHGEQVRGFNAYRRLNHRYTIGADGSDSFAGATVHGDVTAAFGAAGGRLDYNRNTGGGSQFTATLRSPDKPLFGGATWQLVGTMGFDAQRHGYLTQLHDAHDFSTVWRHALTVSIATPVVHVPFGATLGGNLNAGRTWFAFPHHDDSLGANATLTKPLARNLTLFAGYQGAWNQDVFPFAQELFYPPTTVFTPDGTPYTGYLAFNGAKTARSVNTDFQFTPSVTTQYRVSLIHTNDFPQFNGYGRPQWEARGEIRFRPFPNIGIDVGRAYDFAWGGQHWEPRWTFAIQP